MSNNDCCVFDRGGFCAALISRECANCRFRKTKEELDNGRKKAILRVRGLPRQKFAYLKITYKQKYEVK